MAVWKKQHFRFNDNCWAVDGSLTTAQHYQNMRALFAFDMSEVDARIDEMDKQSKISSGKGCKNTSGDPDPALTEWLNMLSSSCLQQAILGTSGLGYVCQRCPDDGKTDMATMIQYKIEIIKDNDGNVLKQNTIWDDDTAWIKFNTIANCYITGGEDERGEFELEQPTPSTNPPTNKCYYSKE